MSCPLSAVPCEVPYRINLSHPPVGALDVLVDLGALDIELLGDGLAAIVPDDLTLDTLAGKLGTVVTRSAATARDNGSVWLLSPRAVRIGGLLIAPPDVAAPPDALRLIDSEAFGTGHHATTALCLEALEEILSLEPIGSILDIGTGSGILALAALRMGVPRAVGLDIDGDALKAAAENALLNRLTDRLQLVQGGPDAVKGNWPLVVANVLASPLIEMAPAVAQRLGSRGHLVLSGIASSLEAEVRQAYQHLGIRHVVSRTRGGWTALMLQACW